MRQQLQIIQKQKKSEATGASSPKKKRTLSTSDTAYILCGIESVLEEVVVDARNLSLFLQSVCVCVCVRERERERERRERERVLGNDTPQENNEQEERREEEE